MRPARWRILGLSGVLLCACAQNATNHVPPPAQQQSGASAAAVERLGAPPPTPPPDVSGDVFAKVGDREIRGDELAHEFFRSFRREAFSALNQLVVRDVIDRESKRLGLDLPADFAATERQRIANDLKTQAVTAYGSGTSPERFVELEYKQRFDDWIRARVAAAREKWTIARIIRYHALLTERLELQLLTVSDERLARELAQKLDQGADLGTLAMKHSTHQSAEQGGRLPPLPLDALHPKVAERVTALQPGQRTGILQVADEAGRSQFEIVRLIQRLPGQDVSWTAAAPQIEQGLERAPVTSDEYVAWQYRLFKLYNVWFDDSL